LDNASSAFESETSTNKSDEQKLYSKIGQFQIENDFLKHVLDK